MPTGAATIVVAVLLSTSDRVIVTTINTVRTAQAGMPSVNVDQPACNQLGPAGCLQRRTQRDHRAEQDNDRPFDMGVDLFDRHNLCQYEGDDNQPKRNGQIEQAKCGGGDGGGKNADGQPDFFIGSYCKTAIGQRHDPQPVDHIVGRFGGCEEQQDVARLNFGSAHLFGNRRSPTRNAHQDCASPPTKSDHFRAAPLDARTFRNHGFDQGQPCRIGTQQIFATGLGEIEAQGAAEFIQCVRTCFEDQMRRRLRWPPRALRRNAACLRGSTR